MYKIRQIILISNKTLKESIRKPSVIMGFCLGFILAFMLSDKVVAFSNYHSTYLQFLESFIWTFGDATSIMLISLCLLLIFSDIPNISSDTPFFLIRTSRKIFVLGQIMFVIEETVIFTLFILLSTCFLSSGNAYFGNFWSETAAILGYSNIGEKIAVPSFVKVLEFSYPYQVALKIFCLTLGYSILLTSIIFYFNLFKRKKGMLAGIIYSGVSFLLNPEIISNLFMLSQYQSRLSNIIFGWISPLNHATYYMHNFGYDNLPKLWQSYLVFLILSIMFFILSVMKIKNYLYNFSGTER